MEVKVIFPLGLAVLAEASSTIAILSESDIALCMKALRIPPPRDGLGGRDPLVGSSRHDQHGDFGQPTR